MAVVDSRQDVYNRYQDLVLDLNLDQPTADEAWRNYENLKLRYAMEGCQMPWVACAVYEACMQRTLPTVGGRQGSTVQSNCISLTRMLRFCNMTFTDFLKKKRLWLKMTHLDSEYVKIVNMLETKYSVSNNIFMKYRPIFLDLFTDPAKDPIRPQRSRKQRRPPCNATDLYEFCWTLYILVKGKYPRSTQDLVSSYSLLLSCVDLMYANVKDMARTDLFNPDCSGYPSAACKTEGGWDSSMLPDSIMDYLCLKFNCVIVETKVVQMYNWKPNIKALIEKKLLKGTPSGLCLLEVQHFDHNVKEVRNAYEIDLLSSGEFDERMFLSNDKVLGLPGSSPAGGSPVAAAPVTPMPHLPRRGIMPGDYHLMPQTPITNRGGVAAASGQQQFYSPLSVITTALHKLYHLTRGRTARPSDELAAILQSVSSETSVSIEELLKEMSTNFCKLYCAVEDSNTDGAGVVTSAHVTPGAPVGAGQDSTSTHQQENITPATQDANANNINSASLCTTLRLAKLRLKAVQTLFYTLLESILQDEMKRKGNVEAFLKQELFFRTLFVCCLELVLKCYNDPLKFPWSLQVGGVAAYHFVRIIEPLVRSEQQQDNRLPRDLVNHLKRIEEQVLDSLVWESDSPLWSILKEDKRGVPSCKDVNFSGLLDSKSGGANSTPGQQTPASLHSMLMSPAPHNRHHRPHASPRQSPLSSGAGSERLGLQSPPGGNRGSVKRTLLFPADSCTTAPAISTAAASVLNTAAAAANSNATNTAASVVAVVISQHSVGQEPVTSPAAQTNGTSSNSQQQQTDDSVGERPRRHGSLGLFFRKVYNVANLRLCELCDRLEINTGDLRRKIWTVLEYAIRHHTHLLQDRHLDQLLMCTTYTVCKVTGESRTFTDIMKQYRCQPQADSHIYRSVLISRQSDPGPSGASSSDTSAAGAGRSISLPPSLPPPLPYSSLTPVETINAASGGKGLLPWKVNGTSTSFKNEERGDLIRFYNHVYVPILSSFALRFRETNSDSGGSSMPPLSPLPMVRATPVSPWRRISATRPVFVRSMTAPAAAPALATASPRHASPYVFNKSPAKNLRAINTMVNLSVGNNNTYRGEGQQQKRAHSDDSSSNSDKRFKGITRRLNSVLDERQLSSSSTSATSDAAESGLLQDGGGCVVPTLPSSLSTCSMSSADTIILTNGAAHDDHHMNHDSTDAGENGHHHHS